MKNGKNIVKRNWFGRLSDPVAFPDFCFYWSLGPAASILIRVSGIICVLSSIVSFSNHRPCLEKDWVSRSFAENEISQFAENEMKQTIK